MAGIGTAWAVLLGLLIFPSLSHAKICDPKTFEPTSFEGAWNGEVTLCQQWNFDQQQRFWFTAQGSLIVPYDWFLVLEQKDSTKKNPTLFRDGDHIDGFRYLPQKPTSTLNPDGLAIGFTKDVTRGRQPYRGIAKHWLGITCAACHTNQIEYVNENGTTHRMLIDGAPTMGDFQGFFNALADALIATRNDDAKFDRFAAAVLGKLMSDRRKRRIKRDLDEVIEIRQAWNNRNKGEHPYGFARLDALGAILNEIATVPLALPGNHRSANAPVSYPFLWDTPHYDRVQWNGSIKNEGQGALARNIGEVLGVFGALRYDRPFRPLGNKTSIDIKKLGELEELISTLESPQWPEQYLGVIKTEKAKMGRKHFMKYCADCHQDPNTRPLVAKMMTADEIGTDSQMAENFVRRMFETGKLEGKPARYLRLLSKKERLKDPEDFGKTILGYAVVGTIVSELRRHLFRTLKAIGAGRSGDRRASDQEKEDQLKRTLIQGVPTEEGLEKYLTVDSVKEADESPECDPFKEACYKARSLNGIWSTAPYLHNGSVRTMRDLLLPSNKRQEKFRVGSRVYVPADMGFKDDGKFELDTSLPGNSNTGHEDGEGEDVFGNEVFLNHPEMLEEILEYLKTL